MRKFYPALTRILSGIICLFLFAITVGAQANGDYKTKASGNWNGSSVWQKYNGSSWVNTSTPPTNANGVVTISHNITVTANATASQIVLAGNVLDINNGITLAVSGNLTINAGTLKTESTAFTIVTATLTIGGNLTLNNSGVMTSESAALSGATLNVELKGNFVMNNTSAIHTDQDFLSAAAMNFTFNGTGTQLFLKTGGTIANTINFSVLSGSTIDFSSSILNGSDGSFTLNDGAKIIVGSSNPVQVNGTRTFSSNADYEFKNSVTPTFTTTPVANTARDIIINNTSGNVTLSQPMAVTRDLKLLNGELQTTSTNIITINDNATVSTYSNSSFINGPVIKKGNDDFTFPVGRTGAGLIPIKISGLSGSSDFKAEYKRAPAPSGTSITASGLKRVSHCEYWTLDRTGSATANVTLYWNPQSNCNAASYVTELSTIVVAHFNGTNWDAYGRSGGTTGTISSGSVTWNGVNNFSPFSLGSTSPIQNPLPVLLTNVIAYEKNNGIQVEWTNMTESNIDEYIIERSANGIDFTSIAKQQPRSNNNDRADYIQLDVAPIPGLNYYRIVAVENNGKTIMSRIMKVETGKKEQSILIYPNPVIGKQLNIIVTNVTPGQYKLRVMNATANEVLLKTINSRNSVIAGIVELPVLPKGIYTLLITGDNYTQTKLFIIQ